MAEIVPSPTNRQPQARDSSFAKPEHLHVHIADLHVDQGELLLQSLRQAQLL